MELTEILEGLNERSRAAFREGERIRSFSAYTRDLIESPYAYTRSAPQYLRDMMRYYGQETRRSFGEDVIRLRLFDAPFDGGKDRVYGQERVQWQIYQQLANFAREGFANRLILLHGPNGSSKTSIIQMVFRGLEHFSRQPEGAIYAYSWIFPKKEVGAGTLGFGSTEHEPRPKDDREYPSFAYLKSEEIATRLICELKDPPFFLLPLAERERLLEEGREQGVFREEAARHFLDGRPCQKCKSIYENLLNSYQGDWLKVVQHVRVERMFISKRYRTGAVTVEPQMHVDANIRQISADVSIAELPASLQNLPMFQPFGDLTDANPGLIEYSDLLKRPIEMNRYLLGASEKGQLNLEAQMVYLNLVMMGTSNEKQLDAFKQTADFTSFRGRLALIQTPYILEARKESRIYEPILDNVRLRRHVTPHLSEAAGLWAVLTRLRRPDPDNYPANLRAIISRLSPLQKAYLYSDEQAPDELKESDRKLLISWVPRIRAEWQDDINYEGRYGASPREMKELIGAAAEQEGEGCVSPLDLFAAMRALVKEKTMYDFLRLEPSGGYHDSEKFIAVVEGEYLKWVTNEITESMDLIEEVEYDRRFEQYFTNVMAYNKKEKVRNPATGELMAASKEVMDGVESLLDLKEDVDPFRKNLVAKIGAWVVDNPGEAVNYRRLFPDILKALKKDFYGRREKTIRRIQEDLMRHGTDEFDSLPPESRKKVESTLRRMQSDYGYCDRCSRDVIIYVLKQDALPGAS